MWSTAGSHSALEAFIASTVGFRIQHKLKKKKITSFFLYKFPQIKIKILKMKSLMEFSPFTTNIVEAEPWV